MKYYFSSRSIWVVLFLCCLILVSNQAMGQFSGVRQFPIPGNPIIQGADNTGETKTALWLTENNLKGIGRLQINPGPCTGAIFTEFVASDLGALPFFDPFKIANGTFPIITKTDQTLLATPPFSYVPYPIATKQIIAAVNAVSPIIPRPVFTLPEAERIGMLMTGFGASSPYFWIWDPHNAFLNMPWDIQKASFDDASVWVSDKVPQDGIYQFFPGKSLIRRWNTSPLKVKVFHASKIGRNTYIWLAGSDSTGTDCIGLLQDNGKFIVWKLNGGPRTMNSITFTGSATQYLNSCEVWLTSSSAPYVTILSPLTQFKGRTDYVCYIHQNREGVNGVYFPGPIGAAYSIPVWMTQEPAAPPNMNILSNNYAAPATVIQNIKMKSKYKDYQLPRDTIRAIPMQYAIHDTCYPLDSENDTIGCITKGKHWTQALGLNSNFQGALLDIDMMRWVQSANEQAIAILWHEPVAHKIGMFMYPPVLGFDFKNDMGNVDGDEEVTKFSLSQNYPNPFNPVTSITYSLPEQARVTIKIYNTLGQEVMTLIDDRLMEAGTQSAVLDAVNLPSGVYYYHISAIGITTDNHTGKKLVDVKKMMLMK